MSNEIFGEFLGDVEMYGDSPCTRGIAVRMFHQAMAKVHRAHYEKFGEQVTPHYTIIAHSLGTVMTLDAITYAHANVQSRRSVTNVKATSEQLHFHGYDCASQVSKSLAGKTVELPSVEWVKYLYSYVTLGSPIDKYLALWTENYAHFTHTDWMDEQLIADRKTKIRHFNYADEQDPVGHELNLLKTTPVWQKLMEPGEDVVFTRYALPSVAHVDYWQDYDLFNRILDVSIDNREQLLTQDEKPQGHYVEWFENAIYNKALFISYIAIPIVGWIIATLCLDVLVQAFIATKTTMSVSAGDSSGFPWTTLLIFLLTLYLTHVVMELIIKWRLVMVVARSQKSPMEEKDQRKNARDRIRNIILWTPFLWSVLFLLSFIPNINSFLPEVLTPFLSTLQVGLFLASLVAFDIRSVYNTSRNKWKNLKNDFQGITFADYLKPLQK